jgi:hypothetical protein
MSTREEISQLLEQWFQLTQAEGRAIQLAAWSEVKKVQADKAALQVSLTQVRHKFDRESFSRFASKPVEHPFRDTISRLLSLETRNSELMAGQVKRARAEKETLEQAHRNLRRLQKSYVGEALPVAWNSYS